MSPSVSILIVNWNGRPLLERNLPHVLDASGSGCEVIVADNASTDGSLDLLRDRFPQVKAVALPQNLGFTGGNLAALREARGKFIVTLNNDARPEPGWIDPLLRTMAERPDAGICASLILNEDGTLVDSAGDELETTFAPRKRSAGIPPESDARVREVFSACGGAAMYRRAMLDRIGFFERDFFLVYEDLDLSFRARLAGWTVLHVPASRVLHATGSTLKRVPDVHAYHLYRNLEAVWIRNAPGRVILRHAVGLGLRILLGVWEARRKLGPRFALYRKAQRSLLLRLPILLRQRRRIRKLRRSTPDEIERALTPVPELRPSYWSAEIRRVLRW